MIPVFKRIIFILTIIAALWSSNGLAENAVKSVADLRVFAVYEPVFTQQDVDILSRVQPDFVCRGWFKWHNTPEWQRYAPLAQACQAQGILLQGGITCAAIYPGENGIDDATFRDFTCHGTDGQPYRCSHGSGEGWYHLSLYNPKVIETLKREVHLQIDAGAVGIWYDEIEGYYDWNPTEGYDPYACAAFRSWLIRKYCDGQGWRADDPRWQTQFNIDLAEHSGSIRTFDYLHHLQTTPGINSQPLATDPPQGNPRNWATSPNPLYREWGFAWDRKARGTFRFDTVAAIFADLLADAERYARTKYGRTLISTYNHNGTARPGVAFLQPHNGAQPPLRRNRLDGRISYLDYYETLISDAAELCPDQPVVFFIDWPGETDRLTALPRADQSHFFSLYIPEAYAAGGEFALPLRGYSYIAADQGTLGLLARMADFYRTYAPWLRGSQPLAQQPEAPELLTVRARSAAGGTVVHLVNHAFSTREIWPQPRTNLVLSLAWNAPAPPAAFAVSPDFPEQRPVPLTLKDGKLALSVGTVTCSALVIIPDQRALPAISGEAATGTHILAPGGRALAIARDNRFTLWLPAEAAELECLETGERLPARNGVIFRPPPEGGFASGLILDRFGIPARHIELTSGTHRWHTDGWGRFRLPLNQASNRQITACVENGTTNTIPLTGNFTAWRVFDARRPIGTFNNASLDGFWPNWPDKEKSPGVITLAQVEHLGQPAMRCTFSPAPRVSWQNINSPPFETGQADALELRYAGDGSQRTVKLLLYAPQSAITPPFFHTRIPLNTQEWQSRRIALSEFRNDQGTPFDSRTVRGSLSFQLAPAADTHAAAPSGEPAILWLQSVHLISSTPLRQEWQSDLPFDAVDIDNLRAGHPPQDPPPAIAARRPLFRFDTLPPRLLANWAEKDTAGAAPMAVTERITPAGQPPFLRITFAPGSCAWANVNVPIAIDNLRTQDGILIRLRVEPASSMVALALHSAQSNGEPEFYHAECEAGSRWSELILPWREFTRSDARRFDPSVSAWANLQICRPAADLKEPVVIEIAEADTFTARP